ncbi:MAG: DUF4926 domain-containing protein [Saprospiraceae bacterium]|nr:DUF4926 domain-containing protein [Saprospiraceae bacterium]MCF8249754.1 DUF4926 domain-containing protein [Saprospiraceae bacterium]MCF8279239.1 DUF4926 domain-containing protein [Bacteroidales bacterium]MCF8312787.1 DUF4926 domain-containing protein [Saprospiraceae bacterium]MCF8441234.1 DUF4926 domain-containing protein [Saprospiraceae bacterium]
MKFKQYSKAALAEDFPTYKLVKDDLVTIVECLPANDQHGNGYVVEVFDVFGKTLHVIAVKESQLKALLPKAVPSMREPLAA